MDEYAAVEAWRSVVGAARVEPMDKVHNPIWKVTGEDGREWVLKHLPEWPPGVGPVEEYRVLCYLQAGGLPVAAPVVTDDGLIAHNADNLGTDPNEKRPTGAHAYALIPLRDQLWAALIDLPSQLSHGDCNVGNILVHKAKVTGYIDLDHLPHSPRVRDLSYYLASRFQVQIIDGDPDAMAAVLRHYVAGYHSIHPLTERELAAVVPLLLTALVGGAGWCLHGWVPDLPGYERNLQAIEWITSHYDQLVSAAEL